MPTDTHAFDGIEKLWPLAAALAVGLLIGLQRQRGEAAIAGVRTFALVSLAGAAAALLSAIVGGGTAGAVVIMAGLLGVAALAVVGNYVQTARGEGDPGMTTEAAMLVAYAAGAFVGTGHTIVGVAIGVTTAVLLQAKAKLHGFIAGLSERDVRSILTFALITFVVLPAAPDEALGPYGVWNPRHIWLMVVLVVGMGLAAYVTYRMVGPRGGTVAAGLLGGLISSTATTVSISRRERSFASGGTRSASAAACVLLLATATMYVRVLVELRVVAGEDAVRVGGPVAVLLGLTLVMGVAAWFVSFRRSAPAHPTAPPAGDAVATAAAEATEDHGNPTDMRSALVFAGLYALVLLLVAWADEALGDHGVYAAAALAGLTDMDAITLSTGRLVADGMLDPRVAGGAVVLAAMSNLVFKTGIVAVLGGRRLLVLMAVTNGVALAAGGVMLWLWPG